MKARMPFHKKKWWLYSFECWDICINVKVPLVWAQHSWLNDKWFKKSFLFVCFAAEYLNHFIVRSFKYPLQVGN